MAEKKKSGFSKQIIILLIMAVLGYVAGVCICYFTGAVDEFVDALATDYAFIGLGVGAVLGLVFFSNYFFLPQVQPFCFLSFTGTDFTASLIWPLQPMLTWKSAIILELLFPSILTT